jgi:hypothetical protein
MMCVHRTTVTGLTVALMISLHYDNMLMSTNPKSDYNKMKENVVIVDITSIINNTFKWCALDNFYVGRHICYVLRSERFSIYHSCIG